MRHKHNNLIIRLKSPRKYSAALYTFSARERDPETCYSYFGARYYSSDLSVWLSVDPQAAKYPSLSPYTYCANNPVRCVDPNGEDIWTIYDDETISRQKNTKIDRIDVVDKDKIVTKDTEAKYGTIKQLYAKDQHPQGNHLHQWQGDGSGWQTFKYGKLGEVIENCCCPGQLKFFFHLKDKKCTFAVGFRFQKINRESCENQELCP